MKNRQIFTTITLLILGLFPQILFAQTTKFQRIIGGSQDERSYSMAQTNDGGYILTGYTQSNGAGANDAYLIKTDGLGKVLWQKTYGTSGNETGWKVRQTRDSGFVVVGTASTKRGDGLMFKTDKDGNMVWSKVFNSDSTEEAYNIIESRANGDLLITGFVKTDSFGRDAFLAKYTSSGNFVWQRRFGGRGDEEGYAIVEELSGFIAVVGMVIDDNVTTGGQNGVMGDEDYFIARFDPKGNMKWMRNYGTNGEDQAWDIRMYKNLYVLAGWTNSGPGSTDVLLSMIDTFGVHQNSYTYRGTGSGRAFSVIVNPDETFSLTGYMSNSSGDRDAFYLNTNKAGVVNAYSMLGGSSTDGHWPSEVVRTVDGGFTIFTSSNSFKKNSSNDLYIIRMDNKGVTQCNQSGSSPANFGYTLSASNFGSMRSSAQFDNVSLTTNTVKSTFDSVLCCKLQQQVAGPTMRVCKGGSVRIGKPNIPGYVYNWTEVGGTFKSTEASPLVKPTNTSTTYKLVVTSSDGKCLADSGTITVTVRPELKNLNFVRDTFFCFGGSVEVTARSGMINYAWKSKKNTLNGQTITLSQADTMILTVTDTTTCTYTDTLMVTRKALPVFSLGNDTTICDNTKVTLTGPSNMVSYLWNGGEGTKQTFVTSEEKTHTLAVVDKFGCKFSDSKIIFNNPSSKFSLGRDTLICKGINYTIFGPGFLTNFYWNGVSSFSANKTINSPGTYILQASNSFGCIHIDTIVIGQKQDPVFSLGPNGGVCANGGRTLKGPPNQSYLWSDGSTTQNLDVFFPGKYWLKVTGSNGCIFIDTIDLVTVNNPVPELGKDTTICESDSIYLDAGNFVKFKWNTGDTTRLLKVKKAGLFEVTVYDANTCSGIDDRSVKTKFCVKSVKNVKIPGLKVFPNPAKDEINIEWLVKYNNAQLQIFDVSGKVVYSHKANQGLGQYKIDVSKWERGTYFVKISTGETTESLKVILE